ncbi:hypothetical protein EJ06DRAFT_531782 [Trichodelitschia bisporula]|uniref:Uncharacterized protein n=1 Tax=Trichodelitschia bisporula TaxID=703511 RepID=A0A6G1HRK0_9PEZI|nr:hypothetical protein EJ06DRAFT_531782 [Trichodelitschia bisporula]
MPYNRRRHLSFPLSISRSFIPPLSLDIWPRGHPSPSPFAPRRITPPTTHHVRHYHRPSLRSTPARVSCVVHLAPCAPSSPSAATHAIMSPIVVCCLEASRQA